MALLQRDKDRLDDTHHPHERRVSRGGTDVRAGERAGPAPGLIRALITLIGLAIAGLLVWLATTFDLGSTGGFWTAMGLIAAAGLVLGLSQLLGGWTKWGWPRLSPSVFLFAFLPTLILAGGILLAMRPTGDETDQVRGWAQDLGIEGLVSDFWEVPGVLAFTVGLVLAFCFDTSGPRTKFVSHARDDLHDEDVHDYRPVGSTPAGTTGSTTTGATAATHDRSVTDELRSRDSYEATDRTDTSDRTHVDDRTHIVSGRSEDRVDVHDPNRDPDRRDNV